MLHIQRLSGQLKNIGLETQNEYKISRNIKKTAALIIGR